MHAHGDAAPSPVTLAEVVAAISLAADLGLGQPMDHVLRTCVMATRFAERLGVADHDRAATYWVTLFVGAGCTGQSWEISRMFGDDLAWRAGSYRAAPTDIGQLRFLLGAAGSGRGAMQRARIRAELVGTRFRHVQESLISHSTISARLAEELGLGDAVVTALRQAFARWDGKGLPRGVGGEDVALPMRICVLVDAAEVLTREHGLADGLDLMRTVRGRWFEPRLFDAWTELATACIPADAEDLWQSVVRAQPDGRAPLNEQEIDRALELIADYADLKSPWFCGHSRGVAELAAAAAEQAGLRPVEVTTLRRAALLHDIGRNGVPNSIWDKPGPLTPGETERVRLHAYYTDRVLRRSRGLAPLASVASAAHERGDGTGYPREIGGDTIPVLGRYLEAADAYHAMGEPRPHRTPMTSAEAASELRAGARAGTFDGGAVAAVLAAAGHPRRKRAPAPAGLSAREVDVLVLVARGLTNRQIGARLGITTKTAGNVVARIYAKADVSSRAEAALFAMRNGLLSSSHL